MHRETVSTANLNTRVPSMAMRGVFPEPGPAAYSSSLSPSQPSTAPTDGHSGRYSTTAAPAPSPKRMQVLLSDQSTIRLIASPPTTSANRRGDAASRHSAVCSA